MDISLETVGDVDRRERLLQKRGLRPRVRIVLEFLEARDLETAIDLADTYGTSASVNAPLDELQRKLREILDRAPAPPAGEDS